MARIDLLFLHVPKFLTYTRFFPRFFRINFLPTALLALADLLQRQGIATQIVHAGTEAIENRFFSMVSYVKNTKPRVIALDLHRHNQSYHVIETARAIKAAFPGISILLGGFTASFFHEEIMKNFDFVDGIIRGEAEVPIVELVASILQGKDDLFSIPNLTWRRRGRVLVNPLSYAASEEDLNRLSFTNFALLRNYSTYIRHASMPARSDFSKRNDPRISSMMGPVFHLPVGRGCPVQCTWCEAGMANQRTISGRREVIFRRTDDVLQSIKEARSFGYASFHISFDPNPERPEYYIQLFDRLRKDDLRIDCCFESFGLPRLEFIKAFRETFPGPKSVIVLSPDVGSSRLRKFHKGYAYTNRALLDCLQKMEEHRVLSELFFTVGVPFETEEDVHKTIRFQREIRRRFSKVKRIRTLTMGIAPGSPCHLDPESYGMMTCLRSFMDFYHYHSAGKGSKSTLGYWIPGYFSETKNEGEFERALQRLSSSSLGSFSQLWGRGLSDLSHAVCTLRNWIEKRRHGSSACLSTDSNEKKKEDPVPLN